MRKIAREPRTDGDVTRARILDAAGEMFSTTGFAETSSKAVAAQASVDVASINYHFGSRGGLYQAVLVEAHRRVVDLADLQRLSESDAVATAKLRKLIERLVDAATASPRGWHLHVLAREVMAPSSHLQLLFQDAVRPKLSVIKGIIGDITGIPAEDPALSACLISVAAPCLMLLVGGPNGPGPIRELHQLPREAIVDHFYSFALAGLASASRKHGGSRA